MKTQRRWPGGDAFVCVALILVACGLTATQKEGMARDAAAVGVITARCELAQRAAGGSGGLRGAVDKQCEADLDALDARGAEAGAP